MKESQYQNKLKKTLKKRFPGAIILKNDPNWLQGVPDFTILLGEKWATLEIKTSEAEPHQPNQDYYVNKMNEMSYSAFIFPEKEKEILDEVQRALESGRTPCVSKS